MKDHYSPISRGKNQKGATITIPGWVPLAQMYRFEYTPDKKLVYVPVIE